MIHIADLVAGHNQYGLWHGTRAEVKDGLVLGSNALGNAKEVIACIWEVICRSTGNNLEDVRSDDVTKFFLHPDSLRRAVSIGNTIRFLRKDFNYSVIAFSFNRFAADGYAREGSELANAILALIDSALLEYPDAFETPLLREKIQQAHQTAGRLISSTGKILKLVRIPEHGYFCTPDRPDQVADQLAHHLFPERLICTELFFIGSIPLDHFIIQEI
jgi:hypothetical protein